MPCSDARFARSPGRLTQSADAHRRDRSALGPGPTGALRRHRARRRPARGRLPGRGPRGDALHHGRLDLAGRATLDPREVRGRRASAWRSPSCATSCTPTRRSARGAPTSCTTTPSSARSSPPTAILGRVPVATTIHGPFNEELTDLYERLRRACRSSPSRTRRPRSAPTRRCRPRDPSRRSPPRTSPSVPATAGTACSSAACRRTRGRTAPLLPARPQGCRC